MRPILILYATREGHTRQIAGHLATMVGSDGLSFELKDVKDIAHGFSPGAYSAAIIAASIHVGKHEPEIVAFLKRHADELNQMPTALISVSLTEASAEDEAATEEVRAHAAAEVDSMIHRLLRETHWEPTYIHPAAGALMYTKYNPLVRFLMKRIAK